MLFSANLGSLRGLHALRQGRTHAAGSHLLDPDTGLGIHAAALAFSWA